jgi:hypothetical protein
MTSLIDENLLACAQWRVTTDAAAEKTAFVPQGATDPAAGGGMPPGGDPAAGGMPPGGDPAAGGMPPGGPPMDPAMAGGAPPMDPAMAGGAPPMDPMAGGGGDIMGMITQAVTQAMAQQGGGAAGPGGKPGGAAKVDPAMLYLELGRLRKMLDGLFRHMDIPLPPDILDDNMVAQQIAGGGAQSQPIGEGGDPATGGPPPGMPAIGQSPAINPIAPAGGAPPADPMAGGGEAKMGSIDGGPPSIKTIFMADKQSSAADSASQLQRNVLALAALSRSLAAKHGMQ